jgi:hypothetical protein
MNDHEQHSFTPAQAAANMRERYGNDAPVHATYNLMLYDKGTPGYLHWRAVHEQLTIREFDTPDSNLRHAQQHDALTSDLRLLFMEYGGGSVVEQVSRRISMADPDDPSEVY